MTPIIQSEGAKWISEARMANKQVIVKGIPTVAGSA